MQEESLLSRKKRVRRLALEKRDALSLEERTAYSHRIAEIMWELKRYREAEIIFAYAAVRSEAMTAELIDRALQDGKRVFLPRVEGAEMRFFEIRSRGELIKGFRGISEPEGDPARAWTEDMQKEKAMLWMPGAAFDRSHHRIGYGGGYYDRYLEKAGEGMTTAALAYFCQVSSEIPWEEHDKMPEFIVTEQGII